MDEREKERKQTHAWILEEQIFFLCHDHSTVGVGHMTLPQNFNPLLRFMSHVVLVSSRSASAHCHCFLCSQLKCCICLLFAQQLQINHMVAVTTYLLACNGQMEGIIWLAGGRSSDYGLRCVSEGDRRRCVGHSRHPSALAWWHVSSQWGLTPAFIFQLVHICGSLELSGIHTQTHTPSGAHVCLHNVGFTHICTLEWWLSSG